MITLGYSSPIMETSALITPLFFPLFLNSSEERDKLRDYMIKNMVYTPIHWKKPSSVGTKNILYDIELSIPCDQRYCEEDMEMIIRLLNKFKENTSD